MNMNMKKLLAAMLVFLAGCGALSPEAKARKVAETMIESLDKGDFDGAEAVSVDDGLQAIRSIRENFSTGFSEADGEYYTNEIKQKMQDMSDAMAEKAFNNGKITSVEKIDDNQYAVTFTMDFMDFSELGQKVNSEQSQQKIMDIVSQSGDLMAKYGETEGTKQMMGQMADFVYTTYMYAMNDVSYNNEETKLIIQKQEDGKWLVSDIQ